MEDEEFVGCMSCMKTTNLCDLFAECMDNSETYAKKLETCFDLKIPAHLKYICSECAEKLDVSVAFKEQTVKGLSSLQTVKDEEYLDETILEEAESVTPDNHEKTSIISNCGSEADDEYNDDEDHAIQALDETTCIYCDLQLNSIEDVNEHIRVVHKLEPRTGLPLRECTICGVALQDVADHHNRCHGVKSDADGRKYPCHFCDNVYASKKACFTHLRMKHGLKLCNEQTPKYVTRERKKCHLCDRDFSQKQILNKHLWKAHGFEVEKRKAFICPLCDERVSYGSYFSAHLLHAHRVHEQVEQLEFHNMDDFMLFKSAIQEETKYRFRKTTASKQTIEGVRSHYMCSQSGVYVYQGKGKRPAPERQIYKTGKACPAHMIVTETMDSVLVTFYKTHVGHGPMYSTEKENFVRKLGDPYWASVVDYGLIPLPIRGDRCPCSGDEYALPLLHACPYFEPRKPKKIRCETEAGGSIDFEEILKSEPNLEGECGEESSWMCDACGIPLADADKFRAHVATHGLELFPCQYCELDFQNLDDWTRHVRLQHNMASLF